MRAYLCLILIAISVLAHPAACNEIAYAIGPNGETPVGQANITEYKDSDLVSFTTSASPQGPTASYKAQRTVDFIKNEINKKINRGNEPVRDEGLRLAMGRSGAQRIDQICSIYDYMVGNWTFVSDPRGLDLFQYSNYTLEMGKNGGYSGIGDCDDFSILLASLVDSIGGTPRIILAYSPAGGHAYTEVYLGKKNDRDLDRMLKWLRKAYNADVVNAHADNVSGDVWLNMDWWKEPGGANHPGGPFYQAATQVPIYIQEDVPKMPLTSVENKLPRPLFNYTPHQPEVYEMVSFDASGSSDPDGKIVNYAWNFGDGDTTHSTNLKCLHVYTSIGKFPVNLTVTDNDGDQNTRTLEIDVKEPLPEAIGNYSPSDPKAGEAVTFDATHSKSNRGQIIEYEWNFDDGNTGNKAFMKHRYEDSGSYNVTLTVTNDKGLKNSSAFVIIIRKEVEPNRANFLVSAPYPKNNSNTEVMMANAIDWYNKGIALDYQGKPDEAIQAYNNAIEIDPDYAAALYQKGLDLGALGKYDEANKAFDIALEINPFDENIWNDKGLALENSGRYNEAVNAFNKAIELNPNFSWPYSNLGTLLYSLNRYSDALLFFEKAIQLNPLDGRIWYNKGLDLEALGRINEAIAAYATAEELGYMG